MGAGAHRDMESERERRFVEEFKEIVEGEGHTVE